MMQVHGMSLKANKESFIQRMQQQNAGGARRATEDCPKPTRPPPVGDLSPQIR
jgi:hypothetical protein